MSKSTLQILKEARELISAPERWTQKCGARDCFGSPVVPTCESAVSFCMLGSVAWLTGCDERYDRAVDRLREFVGGSIPVFNDSHSHAEVLQAFDTAISAEERRAAS